MVDRAEGWQGLETLGRPCADTCSMGSANVELVRSIFADWERGDYSVVRWADAQIECRIADGPSPGRWTGITNMVEGMADFLSAWENYRGEADEYRELDQERVFVLHHFAGRGKTSGVDLRDMRAEGASLFLLRDGKVFRLVNYIDRDRALADLGLEG
jgi:ketosteroid isomerase-like protein